MKKPESPDALIEKTTISFLVGALELASKIAHPTAKEQSDFDGLESQEKEYDKNTYHKPR